jgi:hypothetical protein
MFKRSSIGLYAVVAAAILLAARPASAQFKARPISEPAIGENYHIEASAGIWATSSDMSISSESLGIIGSNIDFKTDLGLESSRFKELHVVARPGRKHKLRFDMIPISLTATDHRLTRTIVFNGQAYTVGLPVDSTFDWRTFRFGYEYDFLSRDRWFAGFIADVKYTDVEARLETAFIKEYVRARGPVPAIGGIGRYYVLPNVSITGELTRIPLPERLTDDYSARYLDLGIYGTVNFTNYVGAQVGYRKFDVGYKFEDDTGGFNVRGLYFGVVARY